jgi:hypothetical protein
VSRIYRWSDGEVSLEFSQLPITSEVSIVEVGYLALIKNIQARSNDEFHQGFPSTITIGANLRCVMRVGVALNDQVEMFFFAVSQEFLQLLSRRRILGIILEIRRTNHHPPVRLILKVLEKDRHQAHAGESRQQPTVHVS